ncbi:hypothetical protein A6M21_17320 [Desulfotomaculum copahuensis]|uniref:PurE domain-containing protein n=1 Tax=Desulfotomaculum copahuensis TaxID=1838280 RepID=A0A1B7LGS8_9FIRM|nr:hypothetical protein A6M21_17320 [Desulfotomaculum copahuensis]
MGNDVRKAYNAGVAGIHRLLDKLDLIRRTHVIIVVAGMEGGALAGVAGGLAGQPVIAVSTSVGYWASLNGLSAPPVACWTAFNMSSISKNLFMPRISFCQLHVNDWHNVSGYIPAAQTRQRSLSVSTGCRRSRPGVARI